MENYIKIINLFIKVNLKIITMMVGVSQIFIKENLDKENMMDMVFINNMLLNKNKTRIKIIYHFIIKGIFRMDYTQVQVYK
jgi:hypothetical protein